MIQSGYHEQACALRPPNAPDNFSTVRPQPKEIEKGQPPGQLPRADFETPRLLGSAFSPRRMAGAEAIPVNRLGCSAFGRKPCDAFPTMDLRGVYDHVLQGIGYRNRTLLKCNQFSGHPVSRILTNTRDGPGWVLA
jgi:hypothetical protein